MTEDHIQDFQESFGNFEKSSKFLNSGVNNILIDLNPNDVGSIIAYALCSNVYFDALIHYDYMGIKIDLENEGE